MHENQNVTAGAQSVAAQRRATVGNAPRKAGAIDHAISQVTRANQALATLCSRMEEVADHVCGPQNEPTPLPGDKSEPNGDLQRLNVAIESLHELIARAERTVERIAHI